MTGPAYRIALLVIVIEVFLTACAEQPNIPVVERPQPPTEAINHHWVADGETLYAIAWRYNMDYRALARANQLRSPYRIRQGQRLSLLLPAKAAYVAPSPVATPGERSRKPRKKKSKVGPTQWRWPAQGTLGRRFASTGSKIHKGIDIEGRSGQGVVAASAGEVVYAGTGLPAYGRLLIVKHNEMYLSAYAHNSRLLVAEGQRVTSGQRIALMGATGTSHNHLHFEIRRKGVPVDPLTKLPRSDKAK